MKKLIGMIAIATVFSIVMMGCNKGEEGDTGAPATPPVKKDGDTKGTPPATTAGTAGTTAGTTAPTSGGDTSAPTTAGGATPAATAGAGATPAPTTGGK